MRKIVQFFIAIYFVGGLVSAHQPTIYETPIDKFVNAVVQNFDKTCHTRLRSIFDRVVKEDRYQIIRPSYEKNCVMKYCNIPFVMFVTGDFEGEGCTITKPIVVNGKMALKKCTINTSLIIATKGFSAKDCEGVSDCKYDEAHISTKS